jgi:hypothetical protein
MNKFTNGMRIRAMLSANDRSIAGITSAAETLPT